VWIHGDLIRGNMLVDEGRLSAVIDFSCLCIGDPACDVMVAWTFLSSESRGVFRAELGVDDATWSRARGWALSFGLIALPYYIDTNPLIALDARRAITEVLDDEATGDD
jgi:aminoglycoside phosphotransferase (APT) family kinase protein